jgi:valyl-tRNA synthetase
VTVEEEASLCPRASNTAELMPQALLSCQLELEDKWVLSKFNTLAGEVCENIDKYELGVAAAKIYDFIWDTFCDWYIELVKPRLQKMTNKDELNIDRKMEGGELEDKDCDKNSAQRVLLYVLTETLTLLHPFMPFITEEIYQTLLTFSSDFDADSDSSISGSDSGNNPSLLMVRKYPEYQESLHFSQEEADFESIMTAIRAVRSRRSEMNVPPSKKSSLIIVTDKMSVFEAGHDYIARLAYASELTICVSAPEDLSNLVTVVTNDARLFMPLAELVDIEKERDRVDKEIAKVKADIERVEQKLSNEQFISKAPESVVQTERDRLEKLNALLANLCQSQRNF